MTSLQITIRRTIITAAALLSCFVLPGYSQVSPDEIRDPQLKAIEKTYLAELRAANLAIAQLHFPFPFQLNRYVGRDLDHQSGGDTRGLEFVKFHDQTVMKVTGNYAAAYNASAITENQRGSKVMEELVAPMLGILCRQFSPSQDYTRFGFEISFHVRQREKGYDYEGKENFVLVLDRQDALAYVNARNTGERQDLLARSEVYMNGKPYGLLLGEREPYPVGEGSDLRRMVTAKPTASGLNSMIMAPRANPDFMVSTPRIPPAASVPTAAPASPDAIKDLQKSYQTSLDRMVQELDSQVHFVRYAPPAFIPFHQGLYLELSFTTTLASSAAGSQYRLAALAFDQHIAHLIRPVLAYFKDRADFDGIDFSTTIRLDSANGGEGKPVSVEFILPLKMANAYAAFDSTGQQLIDASFVLINGERVSLNLQAAEAGSPTR